jgi:hypothetical protein
MVPKLVLTGGPCAGKTSCLRAINERFAGDVITAPEAATLVLGSGFPPPGHERIHCSPAEWIAAFQGAILSIQQEVEAAFERLAQNCRVRLIICDRGVLDGAAYWLGGRDEFLRHFGLSLDACFARYCGVLHLQSLAESHPHLYGRAGNAIRFEDVEGARAAERAVRAAWEGHPGLKVIPGGEDVRDKVAQVLAHVEAILATLE